MQMETRETRVYVKNKKTKHVTAVQEYKIKMKPKFKKKWILCEYRKFVNSKIKDMKLQFFGKNKIKNRVNKRKKIYNKENKRN